MDNFEKVEKIREKTGVSYEDAKVALEATGYDLLDAIVYLEKLGKVAAPKYNEYVSAASVDTSSEFDRAQANYEKDCRKSTAGEKLDDFGAWCKRMLKRSCEIKFNVIKDEKNVVSIPLLALIIIFIFAFWAVGILLVVGLFFDYKYNFEGVRPSTFDINDLCDKASETCSGIREEVKNKKDEK